MKIPRMTVGALRRKLIGLADDTPVVVIRSDRDGRGLLEIADVAVHRGEPGRLGEGAAWFRYDDNGSESWLFIETQTP